jgi:hypothetical protein
LRSRTWGVTGSLGYWDWILRRICRTTSTALTSREARVEGGGSMKLTLLSEGESFLSRVPLALIQNSGGVDWRLVGSRAPASRPAEAVAIGCIGHGIYSFSPFHLVVKTPNIPVISSNQQP